MQTTSLASRPSPRAAPAAGISLSEVLFLLGHYRRWIIAGLLLGALAAGAVFYMTPLTYRSEAKLLVRYIADAVAGDPAASGGSVVVLDGRGDNAMNTEIEILASRDTLSTVVDRIGVDAFPLQGTDVATKGEVIRSILQNLQVDVPRRGNLIRVYYDGPEPELSVAVLSRLVEVYQEQHMRVRRSVAGYEFLVQQTDLNRNRLNETEEELRRIRSEFGVVSLGESRQNLTSRAESIRTALGLAEADLAAAEARFKVMEPGSRGSSGRASGSVSERLNLLEQKQQELMLVYRANSRPVQHIRTQIEDLRALYQSALDSEGLEVTDHAGHSVFLPETAEVAVQRARIESLRAQLQHVQEETRKLERNESRIVQLERNRQIHEDNYIAFSRSLEQARISEAVDLAKLSSISVIQPATLVSANHRANLNRNMLIALMGGLFLSLVSIAGLEFIPGRRVRRVADMETGLGMPVLLAVPPVRRRSHRRKRKPSPKASSPLPQDAVDLPTLSNLQVYYDALSAVALRAINADSTEPCVIGVTGAGPGVGVTTMAAGLAVRLAQQHAARVLLMDPEPHSMDSKRLPGIPSSSGALDIQANEQGQVRIIEHNLFMLDPKREAPASSTALVRKWPDLAEQARLDGYRFVVLDLPPFSAISPSLALLRQMHGILLVVESDHSRWTAVREFRNLMERHGGRLAGAVLNKQRCRRSQG